MNPSRLYGPGEHAVREGLLPQSDGEVDAARVQLQEIADDVAESLGLPPAQITVVDDEWPEFTSKDSGPMEIRVTTGAIHSLPDRELWKPPLVGAGLGLVSPITGTDRLAKFPSLLLRTPRLPAILIVEALGLAASTLARAGPYLQWTGRAAAGAGVAALAGALLTKPIADRQQTSRNAEIDSTIVELGGGLPLADALAMLSGARWPGGRSKAEIGLQEDVHLTMSQDALRWRLVRVLNSTRPDKDPDQLVPQRIGAVLTAERGRWTPGRSVADAELPRLTDALRVPSRRDQLRKMVGLSAQAKYPPIGEVVAAWLARPSEGGRPLVLVEPHGTVTATQIGHARAQLQAAFPTRGPANPPFIAFTTNATAPAPGPTGPLVAV